LKEASPVVPLPDLLGIDGTGREARLRRAPQSVSRIEVGFGQVLPALDDVHLSTLLQDSGADGVEGGEGVQVKQEP